MLDLFLMLIDRANLLIPLIVVPGLVILFFAWLECYLFTRKRWWNLTAVLPILGLVCFWKWRDTVWYDVLSMEDRSRFGITRMLEQGLMYFWALGVFIGLIVAIYRTIKRRTKKEPE